MIHAKFIIVAVGLIGTAFVGPSRGAQRPGPEGARSSSRPSARITSRPIFEGKRTLKNSKLSGAARQRFIAPAVAPTPFATPKAASVEATQAPTHAQSAGPMLGPPESPSDAGPTEFVFIPPARLGDRAGLVRLIEARGSWSAAGLRSLAGRAGPPVTLRVSPPPAGKVAVVRCGVKPGGHWTKAVFTATQTGITKTQPIELDGDLLTFEVFPSEDWVDVTLGPDKRASRWIQRGSKNWTLTGCDRTVN